MFKHEIDGETLQPLQMRKTLLKIVKLLSYLLVEKLPISIIGFKKSKEGMQ